MEQTSNNQNKKTWGGARAGSGRPKTVAKTIAFGISTEALAVLEAVEGSRPAFINAAIIAYGQNKTQ
ncbi:MAG: hypothetical protein HUK09_03860 [Bacteroidaceae bacterium]|nr:hypothetical protein [Bacteroidaceae bacterium]